MIYQDINLNMIPSGVRPIVNVSQYDVGERTLRFALFQDASVYTIPSSSVVTIRGKKPDATAFEYQCSYSANVVSVTVQEQMTVLAGKLPCEIRVTKGSTILGSANFYMMVESGPIDANTPISETDIPLLETAVAAAERAEQAASSVEDIVDYAITVKNVTTTGTNLNDYTESGVYRFYSSTVAPTNIPDGNNGYLVVYNYPNGASIKQIWYRTGTVGSNDWHTWVRTSTNGGSTWSGWARYEVIVTDVTQLGLVSGSATIEDAWAALPTWATLRCLASEFVSSELPNESNIGYIEMTKLSGDSRGKIYFHGKETMYADYRMYLTTSSTPTGTWLYDGPPTAATVGSPTGTAVSQVTVSSGTWTNIGSFTLPAGTWMIEVTCRWGTNATGNRRIILADAADSNSVLALFTEDNRNGLSGLQATNRIVTTYRTASSMVVYINALQNSGAGLTADVRYYAYRIG